MRVIIPAAGKGTRLNSAEHDLPKVMHCVSGKPLLEIVLENTSFIEKKDTFIVVGYKKEDIISYFGNEYNYVEQKEQLGTGHAVMTCAEHFVDYDGTVMVTFGDMPLFRREIMQKLCEYHEKHGADCTLLTAENPEPDMWARIVRDKNGNFKAIVEGKDCTPEEAKIKELFSGVLVFNSKSLFGVLPEIGNNNVQNEYYLTEVPELMVKKGMKVITFPTDDGEDLFGVNTKEDLIRCGKIYSKRISGK